MIEVKITDEMIANAKEKALEMGRLKNSILKGKGSVGGFIGEQIAVQVLGGTWSNTYEYDIVLPDGRTVDVKTKQRTVAPQPHYNCSVSKFNPNQRCDLYGFVSILKNHTKGWFLGTISKQEFMRRAELAMKGTHDPSNNFNTPASCYNLTIEELQNVQGIGDNMLGISS
jgi:hypothetical protein